MEIDLTTPALLFSAISFKGGKTKRINMWLA